ncbi:MAG: hypothetical protein BWY80_01392 [Firmicutes bacterium ADurb.Bin456]|nr:MAG: hypothetical protein BWY80_01392 [Firmicutes bacterium ADurb.Bin456]
MKSRPVLGSQASDLFQVRRRTGVGGVGPEHGLYPSFSPAIPFPDKTYAFINGLPGIWRHADHTPGKTGPYTALFCSQGHLIHFKIHIGKGSCTRFNHFQTAQHGAPEDIFLLKFFLQGPDFFTKPLHQGHVISIATHEGHGRVGVTVD